MILIFAGKMQMRTGTASRVAGNGNHLAGHDGSPLPNQYLGKVAIADGIVAVTEGDELARMFVLPHPAHHARQHGIGFFTFGTQVDPVVPAALFAERVDTETIRRSDSNTLQRIGDAHVSPHPLAILIGREFPCRRNRLLIWIGNLFYRGKDFFGVYATDRLPPSYGVELRFSGQTHRQHG